MAGNQGREGVLVAVSYEPPQQVGVRGGVCGLRRRPPAEVAHELFGPGRHEGVLDGERMGSAAMYAVATGGVKLQVPDSLAADARVLLSQSWAPPVDADEDDALDTAFVHDFEDFARFLGIQMIVVIDDRKFRPADFMFRPDQHGARPEIT